MQLVTIYHHAVFQISEIVQLSILNAVHGSYQIGTYNLLWNHVHNNVQRENPTRNLIDF